MARCKARLVIETENAEKVERSIAADNPGYVQTFAEDGKVIAFIEAGTVGSMLATLDDLLVNLRIAGEMIDGETSAHSPLARDTRD